MPDQKISDLGDGGLPLPTDDFVVARGTTNNKLAWSSMSAAVHSSLSGTGAVSIATNGSTISIGVPAQTVQTQNAVDVTLSGNTAGALALVSSGTLTLAGGNNITLSQAGNAVTISGAAAGGAQTAISGIANSQTTYTSGTVSLSALGGLTIRSSTGQIFQFEMPASSSLSATGIVSISTNGSTISIGASQSVQPETQTFVAGISASDTLYTSGTVRFTGSQAATVRSGTGQLVVIDVPVQSVQPETQTAISGIANSQTTYTSGTVSLSELGAITIRSTTGNQFQFSVNSQSVQAETQTFIAGISASNTLYTSGNVRFTGSQAATVRSGTGQLVVIDVPTQSVQPETQTFIGGISASDTLYTSGNVRFTGVGGGVTVSSNTGQRVDISVAAQSVQAETQTFVAGIQNSQTTYTSGTVNLSVVAGNLTIRSTTGQAFQFSMSQTVQPETQTAVSGIANSQTTYTSGTVSLSELGAITIRSTTGNQFQLSVNSQTNQAGSNYAIGNTFGTSSGTHDARTLSIAGDGIISVAASNSGWRISASQSVQAETQTFVGGIGNSQTTYTSGTVNLSVVAGQLTIRSTTGNAFQFSASQSVQAETQTAVSGIANSQTTYTSGTVSLSELGAITIRSTTGNQFQFSVNSQTVQTQNVVDVTLSGNTSGAMALVSSGTLTLAGGNNITLSQAGNAVTISGANVGGAQTGISGLANSQTTYTSGTVSLSELGAITIRSTTGNQFQFSVNSQSVQPETQTFIAGISASDTLYTSGNVRFTGVGGGVTVSSNTGQRVDISVAAQSVQPETQIFVGGVANSQTTYTSGTVSLSELGAITIRSTTGNQFQLSVNSQTVQTQNVVDVTLAGNSTSAGGGYALISSGTMTLAGGNNITLSQNGNAVTISGGAGGAFSAGMSTEGNTAGNTGVTGSRLVLVGSNNISLSQTTGAAGATLTFNGPASSSLSATGAVSISVNGSTISIGAPTQTVQTQGILSVGASTGGNTAGNTTVNTGSRLVFVGSNNITVSQGTAAGATTLTISGPATSAQQTGISAISNSNTTYTSGTIGLSELGAITIRSTTGNQFQFSVNSQTAQTQSNIAGLYDGANSISTGTIRVTDANGVTFSVNGQTLSASVNQSLSMFAVSNTTQSSSGTAHKSALSFAGAGVASVGVTGGSVVISVPAGGGAGFSAGVSTGGNTAGATGISGTQLVLVGTNMVSLSQTTGAGGATVSINATQSVQSQGILSVGVSTGGATSGDTTVNTGSRYVLVGTNITMSQGTAAGATTITVSAPATSSLSASGQVQISTNGSTISIGVPNPIQSFREPINPLLMGATQGIGNSGATNTTVTAWVMPMSLPNDLAFNNILLAAHASFSSNTTSISSVNYSFSMGASLGFYTLNGSTMSQVTSFSGTLGMSNSSAVNVTDMRIGVSVGIGGSSTSKSTLGGANMTAIMSSINSVRQIPLNWSTISNTLTRGQYWVVGAFSALTAGAAQASLSQVGFESSHSILGSAYNPPELMQNTASVTSPYPFLGQATLVNSSNSLMPVSFNTSAITTATAIANSTKFQSLWMRIYSSHSN